MIIYLLYFGISVLDGFELVFPFSLYGYGEIALIISLSNKIVNILKHRQKVKYKYNIINKCITMYNRVVKDLHYIDDVQQIQKNEQTIKELDDIILNNNLQDFIKM